MVYPCFLWNGLCMMINKYQITRSVSLWNIDKRQPLPPFPESAISRSPVTLLGYQQILPLIAYQENTYLGMDLAYK